MIDEKSVDEKMVVVQSMIELVEMKKDIVNTMLKSYTNGKITDEEQKKFYKYLTLQLKDNTSKNNLDNRINSIYKLIQKQYNNYTTLNEIINKLD